MTVHLEKALKGLKDKVQKLSEVVEKSLRMALQSVHTRDAELGKQVVELDKTIDTMEIEVEEECLKILALHQPVAIDLRFLVAVLKLNNDLERIGDLAVNIAERTIYELSQQKEKELPFDFREMGEKTLSMVKRSLQALMEQDTELARQVCRDDQEVDNLHKEMYQKVKQVIQDDPNKFDLLLPLLSVSRQLERIADHATNIAEDVIYMMEGKIVRHKSWK